MISPIPLHYSWIACLRALHPSMQLSWSMLWMSIWVLHIYWLQWPVCSPLKLWLPEACNKSATSNTRCMAIKTCLVAISESHATARHTHLYSWAMLLDHISLVPRPFWRRKREGGGEGEGRGANKFKWDGLLRSNLPWRILFFGVGRLLRPWQTLSFGFDNKQGRVNSPSGSDFLVASPLIALMVPRFEGTGIESLSPREVEWGRSYVLPRTTLVSTVFCAWRPFKFQMERTIFLAFKIFYTPPRVANVKNQPPNFKQLYTMRMKSS